MNCAGDSDSRKPHNDAGTTSLQGQIDHQQAPTDQLALVQIDQISKLGLESGLELGFGLVLKFEIRH